MTEATTLGVMIAILGILLGTGYALGTVMSLVGRDYFTAGLPVGGLVLLAALTVLTAVVAAGVPAYRSSRVVPAAGLTTFG